MNRADATMGFAFQELLHLSSIKKVKNFLMALKLTTGLEIKCLDDETGLRWEGRLAHSP